MTPKDNFQGISEWREQRIIEKAPKTGESPIRVEIRNIIMNSRFDIVREIK